MLRWCLIIGGVALAAVVGSSAGEPPTVGTPGEALAGPAALVHPDAFPVDDPFPIRRLRATEVQLPELQKQLEAGPVVRLPRTDFEARVRSAGRVVADARHTPRITDARFKAALVNGDLVGTAEFALVNPGSTPRMLPLDPMRIALGSATWSDGREAVVGIPTGGTVPALWVDRTGHQTLKFGWSATGVTEPGERKFELRVPTAPTASLELELPAGQVPTVAVSEVLLTGPFAVADNPARATWRVLFGGRSRLDIAIRPAGNPGVPASAALAARYDIIPGQLSCGFEYDLRPTTGTVGEWAFSIDPGLRVTDVVVNNRAGLTVDPPTTPNGPRKLRVTLRQPGAGGKILVSAVAPFPDPQRPSDAPLPGIRPLGAVLDDESLDIHLAPGLKIQDWNPGDYRLTDSQTLSDQTRGLTLSGTLLAPGTDRDFRRLPTVTAAEHESDFTATEQVAWRFDTERVTASVRVSLRVRRGPLFDFSMRVPAGYSLLRSASIPEELITSANVRGRTATIELARPLSAGQSAELTFDFRGPALAVGRQRLAFPAFVVLGAAERSAVMGVYPGSTWNTEFRAGVGTARTGWFDSFSSQTFPGATAVFRSAASDTDGWVELSPARSEFSVEARTRTEAQSRTTTFALQVQSGALPSVVVAESGNELPDRTWRVLNGGNAITSTVAVPLVGPLPMRLWLVQFARPITVEATLETTVPFPGDASAENATRVAVVGARRYTDASSDLRPTPIPTPRDWKFAGLYHVTAVRGRNDVLVVYGGQIISANGNVLPITLPEGAEVRAAAVDGKWVEPGTLRVSANRILNLPLPAQVPMRFEVRYRLSLDSSGLAVSIRSPEPELPISAEARRWWAFVPGVLAGWPVRPWDRGSVAELPLMLADSPLSGPGVVVSRSSGEEIRVATTATADAVGVGLVAVFLALGWAGGRRRHPFYGVLLVAGLFTMALIGQLGPPWWQRAAVSPLVAGLVVTAGMVVVRGQRSRQPAVAALLLGMGASLQSDGTAQQPAPTTVVILPANADGQEMMAVPKSVLDKLATLSRPANPGVVLAQADYAVTADESAGRVTAKFTAHVLPGAEPIATIPLSDARLERVSVNGTAAFPGTPRMGFYTVPLPGPGRHEIEVRFVVGITGSGPEKEIRFGVPEVPTAKLTADLPGGVKQAQAVGRIGRQSVTDGQRLRLEAELGTGKSAHLRWRDGAAGTAAVKVREGCVWDISESGVELTASYIVRVEQGTVSALRFGVPVELEPLSLLVRPLDMGGTAALRDWSIVVDKSGSRIMRLDLQEPTAGRMLVVMSFEPRKAVTRQPVLRFPKVLLNGTTPAETEAVYGVRTKGVTIDEFQRGGVIDFSPDALTREFAAVAELRLDPNAPIRVFRPVAPGSAELRPVLRVNVEQPGVSIDTTWNVAPHRATAAGTLRWTGKDPQPFVEFTLERVQLLEVRGADVAAFTQTGERVRVWLKRALKDGEISWAGTVASPALPFEASTPRVADWRLASDIVKLRPAEGYSLTVERDRGWTHAAGSDHLAYRTNNAAFPPIRVALSATPETLHADELGWLRPGATKPTAAEPPSLNPTPPTTTPTPPSRPTLETSDKLTRWIWPVSAVMIWAASTLLLGLLMIRFPRSTWPEQLSLVGGLFGIAVAPGWWLGLAVWGVARILWLFGTGIRLATIRV